MSHVYCPECGYNNPESARFCAKCGASLIAVEEGEQTQTFAIGDPSDSMDTLDGLGLHGVVLVVRSGGGRAGETFALSESPMVIGRSPECGIFLDDVTVSRRHAVVSNAEGAFAIEDLGSLNGTFLNRSRIEKGELENGDEVQIGKYRLVFLR